VTCDLRELKTNNMPYKKTTTNLREIENITLKLASPERIEEWSYGEVTKPETINYRTQRSEKGGLFDEKIFGPEKDFECYCGKYKGIRYKGIVCEKCGVEITRSIVRRERMGHITLAVPVAHIWFLKGIPSRMALLMGVSASDLEKVVYFAGYLVTKVYDEERARIISEIESEYKTKLKGLKDEKSKDKLKETFNATKKEVESLERGKILDDNTYNKFSMKYGGLFEAEIGAEAIYELFADLDLVKLEKELNERYEDAGAVEKRQIKKRLSLVKSMIKAEIRPEWMFLSNIPITPPALRPMVALEGGRHATSDVNDLYRRVINRNNRLKKLLAINAPHVILRNEKRILQEAVDALMDNSMRQGSTALSQAQKRPLKSLSDSLKGKQGIFRQNLLGKRVDYSGRSVIVVGPELSLDQCGLPKHMALELFRPFVISRLIADEAAFNVRGANRLIDDQIDEVWAILEEVISDKYVLLNRAPTLHRLGIQAFRPVLIEGNAIQVHPLVCTAFNADFDGDQMAVHVPLSREAQMEARKIMASSRNLLKPGNGDPIISVDKLDIVLGCYWTTVMVEGAHGEGKTFSSPNAAITAHDFGIVDFRAKIKVAPTESKKYEAFNGELFETSVGRLLFNSIFPSDYAFINEEVSRKKMSAIVDDLLDKYEVERIPTILDKVKAFGFKYATKSGTTWGLDDIVTPQAKHEMIDEAKVKAEEIDGQFNDGLLSEDERKRKKVELWHSVKNDIKQIIVQELNPAGSVHDMLRSGARGSEDNLAQMAGMKGLILNPRGETIELPVLSSMKEGLTPLEYFITTHGSRKGLADTALNTAKAGYLTRRLFDVGQDVMISENDCGTKEGVIIKTENYDGLQVSMADNLRGRVLAEDVKGTDGKKMFSKGDLLSREDANLIEDSGVEEVMVRTPMRCKSSFGVCQMCYGNDLGTGKLIDLGEAVGTVAAQAIGEPGTQLTMRTFHSGGTASVGGDITMGLPRVEEIFENRTPTNPALIARVDGVISEITEDGRERVIHIVPEVTSKGKKKTDTEYKVRFMRTILVKVGDKVKKGQFLTDGSADIKELFKFGGEDAAKEYIIREINKVYELQAAAISRKHIEVIVRQMFSRFKVKDAGDTSFTEGEVIENSELEEENARVKKGGGKEAKADLMIKGITEVSLTRKSFLSSASFQNTTRVLSRAAVRGAQDPLRGLKENVILGRLIPAGTGFEGSAKHKMIVDLQEEMREEDEMMEEEE
jgi:DNA-directed RNA polymerase subunit beta'